LKKTPTLLISLEMTRTEIIDRCVSIASGVDSWRIQQGKVDKEHLGPLHKAIQEVMDMPLHTSDLDTQFQEQIEATIGAHVVRHGVKVAIIDYVQLAESSNPKSNRFEQVSQFSRMLKRCAKRHGIVIWAVSQLNSQGGTFYGAQLDADCSRKLSIRKKDEEGEDDGSRVIDVELNRFGPSFTVDVQFVKNVHTFREIIKDGNGNVPAPAREADGPAKKKYWMNDNP
jgi:replicative DNA helicase